MRISDWSSDVCSSDLLSYLAEQLGVEAGEIAGYDFSSRTARRHCAEILIHPGYHRMKRVDRAQLTEWIAGELCPGGQSINAMLEHVFLWCRDRRIYGPSRKELERVVRSQRQDYLDNWLIGASDRLSSRSEEHTSELQSLMRISYTVFCLKKKKVRTIKECTNQKHI